MKNDDRDTFNVQNKIFYGRELVYKNEIDDFKNNKIKNLAVQQEKLNKMYKEDEILLECERLKNETT